ncbi:fused DSP-PTPase phosphatase/NAD kinase-like protein [Acuticoccus mangrovi]|uniref:Tyrosine-protein phosphatase n=1 Tax=Acuticoccus mangrovi TaxID=2796142 RepID=A0A934IR74_9HYPH|nr:sulfur transferase domain-containing protein [Acuticoccus mangrovi]MBJ3776154.1 tyrosine-protein phosphatase [Acuticoccus mangrovi]
MTSFIKILRGRTPAARARRKARADRWRRPIESDRDRREAWASLMLADHGVLRLAYRNRHAVTPVLWRSAQPSPADVRWAKQAGVKTVLSLRGDGFGGDLLEQEACARAGLRFERLVLLSRAAPPKDTLRQAIALLPTLEAPVLMHCKSGADRAGLGAALWLIILDDISTAEAKRQLSWRYGHVAQARTGVLDAFLDAYEATGEAAGLSFADWVEEVYDPAALNAAFRSNRAADAVLAAIQRE